MGCSTFSNFTVLRRCVARLGKSVRKSAIGAVQHGIGAVINTPAVDGRKRSSVRAWGLGPRDAGGRLRGQQDHRGRLNPGASRLQKVRMTHFVNRRRRRDLVQHLVGPPMAVPTKFRGGATWQCPAPMCIVLGLSVILGVAVRDRRSNATFPAGHRQGMEGHGTSAARAARTAVPRLSIRYMARKSTSRLDHSHLPLMRSSRFSTSCSG